MRSHPIPDARDSIPRPLRCFGNYWQRKLEPVTNTPAARAKLELHLPKSLSVSTRPINLGFARFEIPAAIAGEPLQMENLFVVLDTGIPAAAVIFRPLIPDEAYSDLIASFSAMTGENPASSFALKKRVLAVQPFTVWSIPFRGVRQSTAELVLISMKGVLGFDSPVVRIYETPELGILIAAGPRLTNITIFDQPKRITQEFMAVPDAIDIDQFVAALLSTYQFTSDETTEAKWLEQLKGTGLRSRPEMTPALDDSVRHSQIADEGRKRRALRQNAQT